MQSCDSNPSLTFLKLVFYLMWSIFSNPCFWTLTNFFIFNFILPVKFKNQNSINNRELLLSFLSPQYSALLSVTYFYFIHLFTKNIAYYTLWSFQYILTLHRELPFKKLFRLLFTATYCSFMRMHFIYSTVDIHRDSILKMLYYVKFQVYARTE